MFLPIGEVDLYNWPMKDQRQLSHDILNLLERLRIMHDLARDKNFDNISKEELEQDLEQALIQIDKCFKQMLQ
ncbi:MAG TPA: hypothetical protein VNJ08_02630 [Bacteriovoracaceae bacterium]|nr:hypothetical protein [Bacteriovoracaceae bacterium]